MNIIICILYISKFHNYLKKLHTCHHGKIPQIFENFIMSCLIESRNKNNVIIASQKSYCFINNLIIRVWSTKYWILDISVIRYKVDVLKYCIKIIKYAIFGNKIAYEEMQTVVVGGIWILIEVLRNTNYACSSFRPHRFEG